MDHLATKNGAALGGDAPAEKQCPPFWFESRSADNLLFSFAVAVVHYWAT